MFKKGKLLKSVFCCNLRNGRKLSEEWTVCRMSVHNIDLENIFCTVTVKKIQFPVPDGRIPLILLCCVPFLMYDMK